MITPPPRDLKCFTACRISRAGAGRGHHRGVEYQRVDPAPPFERFCPDIVGCSFVFEVSGNEVFSLGVDSLQRFPCTVQIARTSAVVRHQVCALTRQDLCRGGPDPL